MRMKVFGGATLSVCIAVWGSTVWAQESTPAETPPSDVPGDDATPTDPTPTAPAAESVPIPVDVPAAPAADQGKIVIGEKLSPLIVTAGVGYAYAAVTHPDLVSHSLSGAFLEVAVGTELDRRFRLSVAFTSFETPIRRAATAGKWEEGEFRRKVASGLHSTMDPTEPTEAQAGGVEVQKTFHAHSIGPRVDFFPLGSQGPYLGMTTALGVMQDLELRLGADLGARVGGEWRPFQSLSLAIEGGAHGQIYGDATAAIPYAEARLTLLVDSSTLKGRSSTPSPNMPMMPRTLPPNAPR